MALDRDPEKLRLRPAIVRRCRRSCTAMPRSPYGFSPRLHCMISLVDGPLAATPRAFRSRSSIRSLGIAAERIKIPPSISSDTTSVPGSNPRRSRSFAGILTWPFDVIRISEFLRCDILNSRLHSVLLRHSNRILGQKLDSGGASVERRLAHNPAGLSARASRVGSRWCFRACNSRPIDGSALGSR